MDRFLYPIGVQLDSSERYLFVANSNFDLRYEGSSIVTVDLDSLSIKDGKTVLTDSFLVDSAYDESDGVLLNISKASRKLYLISTDSDGVSELKKELKLSFSTPATITLDKNRKIAYVGHRDGGKISIVSYKNDDLKIIKAFELSNFSGNVSDIVFDELNDIFYVSSSYSKTLTVFRPIFDSLERVVHIHYFDTIYVSNRSLLTTETPAVEDIEMFEGKLFLGLNSPSAISILENLNGVFKFTKDVKTDYFPVKTICISSEYCVSTLYDSKKMVLFNPERGEIIKELEITQRIYGLTYSKIRKELYMTLFTDNTIGVIDLDDTKSSFFKLKTVI
jgi:DNA-binding beta-propeller fold protein YncE